MIRPIYPLWKYITGYDFVNWLMLAKAKEASAVIFDVTRIKAVKWPREIVLRRFETLLKPMPAFLGLKVELGVHGLEIGGPEQSALSDWARAGRPLFAMKSVLEPRKHEFTVTLRKTARDPSRNSDEEVWRGFAAAIGAFVVEDYDVAPTPLHEQMAIYAGARMNYFVVNGPAFMCSMTPYPLAIFDCEFNREGLVKGGIKPGSKRLPWKFGEQHLVWERPTLDSLLRWHENWEEENAGRTAGRDRTEDRRSLAADFRASSSRHDDDRQIEARDRW